jgi:hypothetical protein
MMQKMSGQKGVGSLCMEMMKKVAEKREDGANFSCAEMMQTMMKNCCGKGEAEKSKEEENNVGDK